MASRRASKVERLRRAQHGAAGEHAARAERRVDEVRRDGGGARNDRCEEKKRRSLRPPIHTRAAPPSVTANPTLHQVTRVISPHDHTDDLLPIRMRVLCKNTYGARLGGKGLLPCAFCSLES